VAKQTRTSARTQIIRAPAPQVITIREPTRQRRRRAGGGGGSKQKRRGRRSKGGGNSNALSQNNLIGAGIGGFGFGLIIKNFPQLPTIPLVGKAGTVAILALIAKGKIPYAKEIGIAAASIAGYQLGTEGHVLGDVAPQVHGIAAQV